MNQITIVRSLNVSSLSVRIMPDGTIKVTAPHLLPKWFIHKFLKEKEAWITKHQQIVKTRLQIKKEGDNEGYLYLGKRYKLELGNNQKELIELEDNKLLLGSKNKKYAKTYLTSWYKQQARKIIVARVHSLAKISQSEFKSISITSAETRWGSCSSNKTLNFNWRLIMAPLPVIDYVVAHELAHLKEMNHSKSFWDAVRKMYPLYREYRTWLKRNGEMLRV
jgi:predicted metal-dependent hydrolase